MDYQNYEDYMREVLGYQNMQNNNMYNTYVAENERYEVPINNIDIEELNGMYPDIYKILYPMVSKIHSQNSHRKITREVLEEMVSEIYNRMEPEEMRSTEAKPLKNGDVRNPNTKNTIPTGEIRRRNFLLEDIIRILLLREFITSSRPGTQFVPVGKPPFRPVGRPPFPYDRPAPHGAPIRPRGYDGLY